MDVLKSVPLLKEIGYLTEAMKIKIFNLAVKGPEIEFKPYNIDAKIVRHPVS